MSYDPENPVRLQPSAIYPNADRDQYRSLGELQFSCKSVNKDNFDPISPNEEISLEDTLSKYPTPFTSITISDFDIDLKVPVKEAIISFLSD